MSEWSQWFVYRSDGPPSGPRSTRAIAEAILAGELSPECWVAAPQGKRWLKAVEVPAVASIVNGSATQRPPRQRDVTAPMPAAQLDAARAQLERLDPPPTMRSAVGADAASVETAIMPPLPSTLPPPPPHFEDELGTAKMEGPFPLPPSSSTPTLSDRMVGSGPTT